MKILTFLCVLLCAGGAFAQSRGGNPVSIEITPLPFANQGTMSVASGSSVTVSSSTVTMTKGTFPAASTALPTGLLKLTSQSNDTVQVSICWYGSNSGCTASSGEVFVPGQSRTIALPNFATSPTQVYCLSGTCHLEVEE